MNATEIVEFISTIDEYKEVAETFINTYGSDIEDVITRMALSSARIQAATYKEFIELGFTEDNAMKLVLNAKFSIMDSANRGK